jgi:uncharacterized membrane protein YbhN (UPF0104 family)
MSGKRLFILVSLFVGIPLFAYTLTTINPEHARAIIQRIRIDYLGAYLLFSVVNLIIFSLVWRLFLRHESPHFTLPHLTLFNYRMTGFALSYVTPGPRLGGEPTRGALVSNQTNITKEDGTKSALMDDLAMFIGGLVFDTIAVILAFSVLPDDWIIKLALGGLVATGALVFVGWYVFVIHGGIQNLLYALAQQVGLDTYTDTKSGQTQTYLHKRTSTLVHASVLGLCTKLIMAVQLYVLLAGLQSPISFLSAVFLAAAIDIAYVIPSYMGVGALEAGQAGVVRLIGMSSGLGVLAAFITRTRDILFSGYGLLALSYYTSSQVRADQKH